MRPFPVTAYLLTLFSFITLLPFVANAPPPSFDITISDAVRGLQFPILDSPMQAVSFLGETVPSIILPIPFIVWLWVKGFRRETAWFVASLVLVSLLTSGVKCLIDRTRPDGGGLSFVSGHTSYFTVLGGYLLFKLKKVVESRRWLTAWRVGLAALVVLTGFSRLYLGAHWPSDVLGGFLLGVLVLFPVLWQVDNRVKIQT